jgi:hypothetical protein
VFILYNCARLAALLRQFEEKVQSGYYPQLIPFEEVDFLLLSKEVSYMDLLDLTAIYVVGVAKQLVVLLDVFPLLIRFCETGYFILFYIFMNEDCLPLNFVC